MEIAQEQRDRIIDEEHLRLLGIGHYIMGGMVIAFASLFIFHFAFLAFFAANADLFAGHHAQPGPSPEGFMKLFAVVLGVIILAGWAFGALTIYVGRCIQRRRRRTLALVVACLNTLLIPFGTILGVLALIVLTRRSVKPLYAS